MQIDPMGYLFAMTAMFVIGLICGIWIGRVTAGDDDHA